MASNNAQMIVAIPLTRKGVLQSKLSQRNPKTKGPGNAKRPRYIEKLPSISAFIPSGARSITNAVLAGFKNPW